MPAKRPNRQQISAAATRQEILRTARRLFAERGYALTSVADLAQEAGVSLPTIYSSVGPKHAIVMALVEFLDFQAGGPDARSRADTVTDPAELIAFCRRHLAGYKCPKSVDVVDQLPRNATGKVLKRDLRARYWAGRNRAV